MVRNQDSIGYIGNVRGRMLSIVDEKQALNSIFKSCVEKRSRSAGAILVHMIYIILFIR